MMLMPATGFNYAGNNQLILQIMRHGKDIEIKLTIATGRNSFI
jgi:hypothetical protein